MLIKLSSKGQLVIPRAIREALHLRAGTQFHVQVEGDRIVLEPVLSHCVDALYGRYTGHDFLTALEQEHQQEIEHEA